MKKLILLISLFFFSPNVSSAPTEQNHDSDPGDCTLDLTDHARFIPIFSESEGNMMAVSAKMRGVAFTAIDPVFHPILLAVREASEDFFQMEREALNQGRDLPGIIRERLYSAAELADELKEIDFHGEGDPPPLVAKVFEMLITLVRFSETEVNSLRTVRSFQDLANSHVLNLRTLIENLHTIKIAEVGDDATDIGKLRRVWLFYAQTEISTYGKVRGTYPPPALAEVVKPDTSSEEKPTPASERPEVIIPPPPPKEPERSDE